MVPPLLPLSSCQYKYIIGGWSHRGVLRLQHFSTTHHTRATESQSVTTELELIFMFMYSAEIPTFSQINSQRLALSIQPSRRVVHHWSSPSIKSNLHKSNVVAAESRHWLDHGHLYLNLPPPNYVHAHQSIRASTNRQQTQCLVLSPTSQSLGFNILVALHDG